MSSSVPDMLVLSNGAGGDGVCGEQGDEAGLGPELGHGPGRGALDRPGRDTEQVSDLVLAAGVEVPQHEDGALLRGERAQRGQQGWPELRRGDRVTRSGVAALVALDQAELLGPPSSRPG